ncbi:MAG: NYN domain-containing protein [Nitrososphaerota archaeon]|nr:NYN domain-containing protein [Nitrososphaerota archaeon]
MVFIDGAVLRRKLREWFGHDRIDLLNFTWYELVRIVDFNVVHGELVRAYFYDAILPPNDPDSAAQEKYYARLRRFEFCEVRLGRVIRGDGGQLRQKGVDALMAIDMVSKAFQGQYDIAVMVANDDDFVDIAKSIRDTGKRLCGAYFEPNVSQRLLDQFDRRKALTKETLAKYMMKEEDWGKGVGSAP